MKCMCSVTIPAQSLTRV